MEHPKWYVRVQGKKNKQYNRRVFVSCGCSCGCWLFVSHMFNTYTTLSFGSIILNGGFALLRSLLPTLLPIKLTILLVGYFVLGPSDLYKLTKEIGKFVQNIRTLGSDLTKTVENNLESQLQLDDLRKAQRELNDAFSFRRSINSDVDDDNDEGFGLRAVEKDEEGKVVTASAADTTATSSSSSTTPAPTKKIRKRRVKKVVPVEDMEESTAMPNGGDIPDWEAPFVGQGEPESEWTPTVSSSISSSSSSSTTGMEDWSPSDYTGIDSAEQRKFQAQMNVDAWNAQVMAQAQQQQPSSQDQQQQRGTSPAYQSFVLTKIMERLALLEEEKNAADALLQEEFRLRADTEEKYYREKRQILEEAVVELEEEGSMLKQTATASAGTGSSNTIV